MTANNDARQIAGLTATSLVPPALPACPTVSSAVSFFFAVSAFLLSFSLLLASSSSAQSTGTTIRHHKVAVSDTPPELTQAEDAIQKKDYAGAEPLLQRVVGADPHNYVAWFDLGFIYKALGRTDESIAAYRKSVAAKPDVFESNLNLGLMLAQNHQPDAEQFLTAATKLQPTSNAEEGLARAWLSLGHLLAASKPEDAIAAFHEAAQLRPKDPEPYLSAGPVFEKQNRFADAEQEYKQVLALDPQSSDALVALANLYVRGRRFGDAEKALQHVIAQHPDNATAHLQLGRVLAADSRYDDAAAELQTALDLAPTDVAARRDLADVLLLAKKNPEAEAQYRALLVQNGKDADLHQGLGEALLRQRKFAEAQQEFLAAVELKPDFGEAYGKLAVAANENQNYPVTIKALDARAKFLPEIPLTYFLRATAYDHLRDRKLAAENYHRFLDTAKGAYPDQEWQARHRLIAIEPKK